MNTLDPNFPIKYRPFEKWNNGRFIFNIHSGESGYDYIAVTTDREPGIVGYRVVTAFETLSDLYDWLEDEKHATYAGRVR